MDYPLDATFTESFSTTVVGVATTLSGSPVVAAFANGAGVGITAGVSLAVDADGLTGINTITVVATANNGFAANTKYDLKLTAGALGNVNIAGTIVGEFGIEPLPLQGPVNVPSGATVEADLTAALKTVANRVFPDFAPSGTVAPWVTYQHIGGRAWRFLDGSAADSRQNIFQISVWAATRMDALVLARQVEAAICNHWALSFVAQPDGEPTGSVDEDGPLYGCIQDFSIASIA